MEKKSLFGGLPDGTGRLWAFLLMTGTVCLIAALSSYQQSIGAAPLLVPDWFRRLYELYGGYYIAFRSVDTVKDVVTAISGALGRGKYLG